MPAQTFLGALAPMPLPVTTAPPGMIERKVLWEGGRRKCARTRDPRRGTHPSFIYETGQARKILREKEGRNQKSPSPSPHGRPFPPRLGDSVSVLFLRSVPPIGHPRPATVRTLFPSSLLLSLPLGLRGRRGGAALPLMRRTNSTKIGISIERSLIAAGHASQTRAAQNNS